MSQIKGKEFDEPFLVPPEDVLTGKRPFLLFSDAYLKLTKIPDKLAMWANAFLGAFLTLLITVAAKYAANKMGEGNIAISKWEGGAIVIVFIVFVALKAVARYGPSDRVMTIEQIEEHFARQPDPAQLWTDIVTKNDAD